MALPPSIVTSPPPSTARLLVIEPEGLAPPLQDFVYPLANAGFRLCHEFVSIADAAEAIEREAVDLVLIGLPEDGIGGIAQIARIPSLGTSVPFLIVDPSSRDEIARHAMRIHAQDYLARDELTPDRLEISMRWSIQRSRELRALRRDNDLFATMLTHVPDRIYFKDRQSRFIRVSTSVARAHAIKDPQTLIGKSDFLLYLPAQAEETFLDEQRVMKTGVPIIGKVARRTLPDGAEMWQSTTKLPLYDRRGRITGTFGITRDITELKQLELALAAERNRLDAANRELTGTVERLQRAHEELKAVQLQLIEAEKLKSIGRLAAGIAHEVKNPLAIISMGIEFLSGRYGSDETTAGVLAEISDAVARADSVVKGLLDFSLPRQIELRQCDINLILRTALRLVRGEIRKDLHRVELRLGDIPEIRADRSKVCQAFVNLLTNALQAMPDGGALSISSRLETDGEKAPRKSVVVEIADTGPGIPEETLNRIFEPFFTTKGAGKGAGLGMSVVRSIMRLLGGDVSVRNRPAGGAVATLAFPANETP